MDKRRNVHYVLPFKVGEINGQFLYSNILKVYFAQAQMIKWKHYFQHPRELANNITSPQEAGIV